MNNLVSPTVNHRSIIKVGLGIVLLLFFLFSTVRQVNVGEVGVVTRLGTVSREVGEGIHLKLPFPIEQIHIFDVKTQKDEVAAASSSQDLQDVDVTLVTNYRLEKSRVGDLYRTVGSAYKERIIDPAIQEAVKATTAQYPIAELITRRPEVKQKALTVLRERLQSRGIVVEDISLTNLSFSQSFSQAIEQKQVAQQEAERAKFNLERARTDSEAQRVQKETLSADLLQKYAIDKWDGKLPQYLGQNSVFGIPNR